MIYSFRTMIDYQADGRSIMKERGRSSDLIPQTHDIVVIRGKAYRVTLRRWEIKSRAREQTIIIKMIEMVE